MHTFSENSTVFVIFFLIGTITDLAFFGGTHLVSASEDQTICIWECGSNWDCLHVLKGHKSVTDYEHYTDILESIIFPGGELILYQFTLQASWPSQWQKTKP